MAKNAASPSANDFACTEKEDGEAAGVLYEDTVPRLLEDVPDQPSPEQLAQDPDRPRFVLIFDREGYSPEFFAEMWRVHRIACQTYRKYPSEPWPEDEFEERRVALPAGQTVTMRLCERRTRLSNGFEVREVRKLGERGHQTSVLSSDYRAETAMALEVRKCLARPDDARAFLRELFTATADILPDPVAQTLTVRLHHLTNPLSTKAVAHLAEILNGTETLHPGTNLRLRYELVSNPNPTNQEF